MNTTEHMTQQLRELQAEAETLARLLDAHGTELTPLHRARLVVDLDLMIGDLQRHKQGLQAAVATPLAASG